jgi:DNA-binding transcriptional regulator YiaG
MNAQQIKELRSKLDLSQENFAREIGVTLGTVARWERGSGVPSPLALEKLEKLARQNQRKEESNDDNKGM